MTEEDADRRRDVVVDDVEVVDDEECRAVGRLLEVLEQLVDHRVG